MNAISTAERGYLGNVSTTRSGRRAEYEVVSRITRRLRDAATKAKSDYPNYVTCLTENRILWQTFAIDVADDSNQLPKELRASIYYLAEFTEVHTQKVLSENASVLPLLEVNMAILRGLKSESSIK